MPRSHHQPVPARRRRLLAAAALIVAVAGVLGAGRPGIVTTNAQQTFEGEVTESETNVTIVRGGMRVTLDKGSVDHIDYTTYAERFDKELAALGANDVDGRVSLARQALQRRDFDSATKALDQALEIDPLDREARRLNATLAAQMSLAARQAGRGVAATDPAAPGEPAVALRRVKGLSPEQINEVRQAELQPTDRVRVRFADNVRKKYVDSQAGMSFQAFSRLNDTEQALAIITRGTREMRESVQILSDPASIDFFGKRIHTAIVQGCATSACHGGRRGGSFTLLGDRPDAATMVTNFYLINSWRRDRAPDPGSVLGGGQDVMIDRGRAGQSLLYEYSLPRSLARIKHPEVRGWNGIFRDGNDRLAVDMATWIDRQLRPTESPYSFTYTPRAETATPETASSRPASRPDE